MRVETRYELGDSPKEDSGVLWPGSPNQNEFVVNTTDKCKMNLVGGKAFNISQLARERFPVPEGFCITTKAYDYFVKFNNIRKDEKIYDRIRESLMPPFLEEVICDAYYIYMQGKRCVVRSSSPVEDLRKASFAGQYKSSLNVGDESLLDSVRECWASLWSRRAVEYRKNKGIEDKDIKMAVLVQEMVQAQASGVLFTEDKIVIEGIWGLGDVLVGGRVIPDRFVVERDKHTVVERKISHKEVMSQIGSMGVEIAETPEDLKDAPVLDDDQIERLCRLGEKVEDFFGCPQDIEWALSNGDFVLLQARPITVRNEVVWSRANIVDNMPGYISHLSRAPENRPDGIVLGLILLLKQFGINEVPENIRIVDYFYGHAYLNMNATRDILGLIPGISPEVVDQSLGHSAEEEETAKSRPNLFELIRLIPGTIRVIRFFFGLPDQANHVIPKAIGVIEGIRCGSPDKMSLQELDDLGWKMYDLNAEVSQVHAVTTMASMSLFNVLQKTLPKEDEGAENLLTMGLEGMSSSQLGIAMWELSQSASKSSRVSELILSRKENVLEELKQFSEGQAFLEDVNRFMNKYGDRGSQELELSSPRLGENPLFVLSMVANYLGSDVNPVKAMEEKKKVRLETTDRILKNLSRNPAKKLLFKKILEKTQQYIVTRENLKTTWMRGVSAMKTIYLALAEKLVNEGILECSEDIFHLKMTEVSDIVAGAMKKEQIDCLIEERRKEKAEYEHIDVPMVFVGNIPPVEDMMYTIEAKEQLEGTGCSHGIVTGKARVVLDPFECSELEDDEILVAPFTDPGWSPLFIAARGLVMEIGGTLSHGVIIAREYGIPAVIGVKDATKIIKTGQIITVDGNRGVVYIRE